MSEPEKFLSRWSRRKREAAEQEEAQETAAETVTPAVPPDQGEQDSDPRACDEPQEKQGEPAFDPASLPPVESIGVGTDIRAFLRQGVPADLTRAALRRAWLADPAIRDFVGLADYAWDFNAPDGVPGFGPLQPSDDLRRLVAQILGEEPTLDAEAHSVALQPETPVEPSQVRDPVIDANARRAEPDQERAGKIQQPDGPPQKLTQVCQSDAENQAIVRSVDGAAQNNTMSANQIRPPQRRHGRALPE